MEMTFIGVANVDTTIKKHHNELMHSLSSFMHCIILHHYQYVYHKLEFGKIFLISRWPFIFSKDLLLKIFMFRDLVPSLEVRMLLQYFMEAL